MRDSKALLDKNTGVALTGYTLNIYAYSAVSPYYTGSALYTYTGDVKSTKIKSADYGGVGVYFGDNDPRNIGEPFYLLPITNNRTEIYAVIKGIEMTVRYDYIQGKTFNKTKW